MLGIFGRKNGHDTEQLERELEERVERIRQAGDDVSKCLRRMGERKREPVPVQPPRLRSAGSN